MTERFSPGVSKEDLRAAIDAYNVVWQSWPSSIDSANVDQIREAAMYAALRSMSWLPIETAPRDGTPIIGWCDHSADPYFLEGENRGLTVYGAHSEGLSQVEDGPHVVVWGGEYDDVDDGYIPPWWFRFGSEWEEVANPIYWKPLGLADERKPEQG